MYKGKHIMSRIQDVYRRKTVHICINVYGGLQYSAKRVFALHTIGFGFSSSTLKSVMVSRR